ncbi:unnamed protein product [Trichobilharzia szidati]|nr:unnamed protein product [Trichobilharzia szidati]
MGLWWQNAKTDYYYYYYYYILKHILLSLIVMQLPLTVNSRCSKFSGSITSATTNYQIIEESPVPMTITNLKKDLCIDQYSIEQYIDFNQYSHKHEFVLFPTSQPFYEYFEIRNESQQHYSTSSSSGYVDIDQYLILRKSIDREAVCNWPNSGGGGSGGVGGGHTGHTNSKLLHSGINHNFYSDSYMHPHYTDEAKGLCNCQELLGWCSVYLHLAYIPLNISESENTAWHPSTPVSEASQPPESMPRSNDHWLNYINVMQFFNIELRLIDINDNAPVFSPFDYKITVSEADKPGTSFRLPSAVDPDLGINAMLSYDIASINASNSQGFTRQLFALNHNNGNPQGNNSTASQSFLLIHENTQKPSTALHSTDQSEINKLYIKLLKPLDREVYSSYVLEIIAVDKGLTHQNTGTLNLYIHVADVNDEVPTFERKQYTFRVSENASPGTLIGQVKAIDMDAGDNSIVRYSIKEVEPYILGNQYNIDLFRIDQVSGEIKLYKSLDREKISEIILRIEAKDNGQPARSTLTSVTIIIEDVNDNSPTIDLWGYKEILNSTGLTVNNIRHVDLMPYQLISTQGSLIPVHIWASEYLNARSIIAIVKVTDPDHGVNGSIQCSLNTTHFILQPESIKDIDNDESGINHAKVYYVISLDQLDYEQQSIHHLPIICSDMGEPLARTSTLLLNIHVQDENDNDPIFLTPEVFSPAQWLNKAQFIDASLESDKSGLFSFHRKISILKTIPIDIVIPETCSINATILKLPVLDIDSGMNSVLSYELKSINQYFISKYSFNQTDELIDRIDFVQINNMTGLITISKSLKLIPENVKFTYDVVVSDYGRPRRSSRLPLSLQVSLVNSFPPEIEFFRPNLANSTISGVEKGSAGKKYELEIYENQPPGTPIGRIVGHDRDRGEAGRVTFKVIQSLVRTCTGAFKKTEDAILVDPDGGTITTLRPLDRDTDGDLFLISLQFQDHGTPAYTSSVHIDIKVLDLNDNAPVFILPLRSCGKSEGQSESKFPEDRSSCSQLNAHPPYDTSSQIYNITMLIPSHTNQDVLHPFTQFKAIDIDAGANSLVTYHLHENCTQSPSQPEKEPVNRLFVIDELSGCLSIIRRITDEQVHTRHTFCIIAQDHGKIIQHSSVIIANIEIKPYNNESLIFMNYSVKSMEQSISARMLPITTSDVDGDDDDDLKQQDQQHSQQSQTLTPVIRTLLCITTIIGGLMIIIVGILSIKQPAWLIRNLCKMKSKEAAKAELLQFHEVHNQIEVKQNRKHQLETNKQCDLEMETVQHDANNHLCTSFITSTNELLITQTKQQPVQIHLPQDYCIDKSDYSKCSDQLLTLYPHSSEYRHHHHRRQSDPSDPPVFLHIVRTCDVISDQDLMKTTIETTTSGHIVESKDTKCIYCNEKHLENWNLNIV